MFERYTEKARRVIFFARYEASQYGAHAIEPEHILLGLLREDKLLVQRLFTTPYTTPLAIRKEIEAATPTLAKVSASVDLPLSSACKSVLSYAADESQRLEHRHIGTEHLLLGILREGQSLAARVLAGHGITAEKIIAASKEQAEPAGRARRHHSSGWRHHSERRDQQF
jgi:ATP-dependent Clp protease ATP-binding subunit ClpC